MISLNRFLLDFLLGFFDGANIHKGLFGQMVPLAFTDLTAASNRLGCGHILAFLAG
jgi:hypothetical protein